MNCWKSISSTPRVGISEAGFATPEEERYARKAEVATTSNLEELLEGLLPEHHPYSFPGRGPTAP